MSSKPVINRYSLSGACATLIGHGIGRFAYIALMPALIQAGWLSKGEASNLGVATLIGYIFGAPLAHLWSKSIPVGWLIRLSMCAVSLSYLGGAFQDAPMFWLYILRFCAGLAGAMLMVLVPPVIVKMHDSAIKARISGVVFSGIGMGMVLSGVIIPFFIVKSVATAWLGIGTIAFLITLLTWPVWSFKPAESPSNTQSSTTCIALSSSQKINLLLILLAYTFNAMGYLPHTLFWVDYIVRELNMSLSAGGFFWATFGVGAAIGPFLVGFAGDKLGIKTSLILAFSLKGFGVALPLLSSHPIALFLSSLLVGIFTPGTVTLISIYTLEWAGYRLHTKAWGAMTLAFAISQGVAGYFMAQYSVQLPSYHGLFAFGALALAVSVLCIVFTGSPKHTAQAA